jgi:hypothetical protein
LIDYLEDDLENVSSKLEKQLINVIYFDGIRKGLEKNVKKAA